MLHIETGMEGERTAAEYLRRKGYFILEQNWKNERLEIDIIAREKDTIIFAEVKTRNGMSHGWPEEAVSEAKQERIAEAAEAYLLKYNVDLEIRFDIISLIHHEGKTQIYHIRDAFAPAGE
jgi:putative endonuclease